jgi:hypothetical protein
LLAHSTGEVRTRRHILLPGMKAYSIFVDRPFSLNFMAILHDAGCFDVAELDLDELKTGFQMEEDLMVYGHIITRLPGSE